MSNHFIEIGKDLSENYWITIHTGSRNFGLKVCNYWQNMGSVGVRKFKQEEFQKTIIDIRSRYSGMEIKNQIRKARESIGLDVNVSDDLMYLEGENAYGYLFDMMLAQKYAETNRQYIMNTILDILYKKEVDPIDIINTSHNFIDFRDFIIRKGTVRSYKGERFLLPFNMRDGILICEGKSNSEWNFSAPHGAGRLMSRSQAKKTVDLNDFKKSMEGIFSTSVGKGTLDESPMAYKDSKIIEIAIEPTATIIDRIKPVMNLKDGEGREID